MKKPLAIKLLILLSALVTIGIPFGAIVWQRSAAKPFALPGFTVLAAIVIQTAAFVLLRRLYKARYGLSSPKFVVCSVLPAAVIPIISMIVIKCMTAAGVFGKAPEHYYDNRAEIELFCAWTVLAYAVCIAAMLSLALVVVSAVEKRRACPKKSALMMLAVINTLLTLVLSGAATYIITASNMLIPGLAVMALHIAASIFIFRLFNRKFDVWYGEFVGHGALPAFVLSCIGGMLGLLLGTLGGADSDFWLMAISMFLGAYSLAYLIVVSAVTCFHNPL